MNEDALVLTLIPPEKNARTYRLVRTLKHLGWEVSVLGPPKGEGKLKISARRFLFRLALLASLAAGGSPQRTGRWAAKSILGFRGHSKTIQSFSGVLICTDTLLTPLLSLAKSSARTIADVRDLSHRLAEQNLLWRWTFGWALKRLMAASLGHADATYTVSRGLAKTLESDFSVSAPAIVKSIPDTEPFPPRPQKEPATLKLVYAGRADRNREIELICAACARIGEPVSLDLYLTGHALDIMRLRFATRRMPNVEIRRPVPLPRLISTLSSYDLGWSAWPPNTLNLAHSLPNKFFEYLTAGIPMVVTGGSEMATIVDKYSCGITVDPEAQSQLIDELTAIDAQRLSQLARGVAKAQKDFVWQKERERLVQVISPTA